MARRPELFREIARAPRWQQAWFWVILGAFWLSGVTFAYKHGNRPHFHTDSSTEGMTIHAAEHYLEHGFFKNYLLPTYPPFGHDPNGKIRTEPFVYTHYLAGPDLVLGLLMKVFGRDAMWFGRVIPHTLTVVALGWLALEFAAFLGSGLMGCVLLSVLMIPRSLTKWSICLYGHSYVMAFYLFLVAGMLALVNRRAGGSWKLACGLGFSVSFLQMFFDLDWVPLTFISALGIVCLLPQLPWVQARRVMGCMLLGGTAALGYQIFVSSLYYGSATWVVENLLQWIQFRTGTEHVAGVTQGDLRLHKVLHEYNRQTYGATGFTALNLVALSVTFLVLGVLGKVRTRTEFFRGLGGVALAYLAAIFWNVVMRQHSVAHIHFIPRHYFVLFMTFLLVALPISHDLVMRARRVSAPAGA
jgi:hypothetical protein